MGGQGRSRLNVFSTGVAVDDRAFLEAFEAAAIPSSDWRHRDHIRMAFLYLRSEPFDTALARIRSGIRALNRANHVEEGLASGYHETMTVAWARLIASTLEVHGPRDDAAAFIEANPHLLATSLLRLYYSRERILTEEAKARFVEPDLAPLPAPTRSAPTP